jgi:hypothetical protein
MDFRTLADARNSSGFLPAGFAAERHQAPTLELAELARPFSLCCARGAAEFRSNRVAGSIQAVPAVSRDLPHHLR